ncbi:hypothetical protein PIB30_050414 [Stylosanthes scabra]|uniref:Uncharacterized protein n=1 Tax=Stylosanthes scabra TaxID=79078 RepID=A0ABU6XIX9_9FABA|nr:hypothetical protein [Stylosanthes scabra]
MAHEEYDDVDVNVTAELGTIKVHRYHFKDEKLTRSVHSGRFDPDRPYEFPIAMLGSGGTFGEFRPIPSAATTPPQMARMEPTLTLGPSVQTYPPCRRRILCVPKRTTLTPGHSPLSISWMGGGDVEMVDNAKEDSAPGEDPEEDPKEDQERSKEESELKSMGASTELEFLRFLTSGQQPMCYSSSSCSSITSRNLDQTSGFSSSTRSIQCENLSGVCLSSPALSQ